MVFYVLKSNSININIVFDPSGIDNINKYQSSSGVALIDSPPPPTCRICSLVSVLEINLMTMIMIWYAKNTMIKYI